MAASFQGFRFQREPLISFALGAFVFVVTVSTAKTPQVVHRDARLEGR